MKRHCFATDLKNDEGLIAAYERWHQNENCWPEVKQSIRDAGIVDMQIYRTGNRLFLIMEVDDSYSPERKAAMDAANEKVQEWELLMWKFQQALPWARKGEKWIEMKQIFKL